MNDEETVPEKEEKKSGILGLIASALASGDITSKDAKELRSKSGIFQSSFTRKPSTRKQRRIRRKVQKQARWTNRLIRKNRCKITKGQKKSGRM